MPSIDEKKEHPWWREGLSEAVKPSHLWHRTNVQKLGGAFVDILSSPKPVGAGGDQVPPPSPRQMAEAIDMRQVVKARPPGFVPENYTFDRNQLRELPEVSFAYRTGAARREEERVAPLRPPGLEAEAAFPAEPPGFNPAATTIGEGGAIRPLEPPRPEVQAPRPETAQPTDVDRLNEILAANQDKNFVQRILRPKEFPTYTFPEGSPHGTYGSHLMASGQVGNKNIAYPMLVQQAPGSELTMLEPREAVDYALKNKEFIEFQTPEEAEWFGKNYKKTWGPEW